MKTRKYGVWISQFVDIFQTIIKCPAKNSALLMFTKFTFQIYGEEFGVIASPDESMPGNVRSGGRRDRARNRKVSDQSSSQTSPKRKESLAKKDR